MRVLQIICIRSASTQYFFMPVTYKDLFQLNVKVYN